VLYISSYTYLGIFQHLSQAKDVLCGNSHASHVLYISSYTYLGIFQHLSQATDVTAETFREIHTFVPTHF
jgi:hypothetical protein